MIGMKKVTGCSRIIFFSCQKMMCSMFRFSACRVAAICTAILFGAVRGAYRAIENLLRSRFNFPYETDWRCCYAVRCKIMVQNQQQGGFHAER